MIYFIICGHGNFADGLYSGLKLLAGEIGNCSVVNFREGMSNEALAAQLQQAVSAAAGRPMLFFTDIIGGTPFRECALAAAQLPVAEVIAGANLQMLVEAAIEREDACNITALAQHLVESARSGIMLLSEHLAAAPKNNTAADDGI